MSHTSITVDKANTLADEALSIVKASRNRQKQITIQNRIDSRNFCLKRFPICRLWLRELTPEEADYGYHWWETYGWRREQSAKAVKALAATSDSGFVQISSEDLLNMSYRT